MTVTPPPNSTLILDMRTEALQQWKLGVFQVPYFSRNDMIDVSQGLQ
jgi:hypothetical protein